MLRFEFPKKKLGLFFETYPQKWPLFTVCRPIGKKKVVKTPLHKPVITFNEIKNQDSIRSCGLATYVPRPDFSTGGFFGPSMSKIWVPWIFLRSKSLPRAKKGWGPVCRQKKLVKKVTFFYFFGLFFHFFSIFWSKNRVFLLFWSKSFEK